jgi:2-keto-4-pentenoate hydratase/2-oxohepta-3-ene-1,7-dioic acid hydratase in catechol pathway
MMFVRFEYDNRRLYGSVDSTQTISVIEGEPFGEHRTTNERVSLSQVRLLAPVSQPRIFGIGYNYYQALKEANVSAPERPLVFTKPSTAVIGPGDDIVYPKGSTHVLFEGELAVVIGKKGRRIAKDKAPEYVFGYTCGNDLTERTLQLAELKSGSMAVSKGFDTFAPLGPVIATGLDPANLSVISKVNGEVRQRGHTSDLVFDVPTLIAYLSNAITLLPGDVIMTGTPAGFGPVVPGDRIEIEIPQIGTLRNSVVQE